MSQTPSLDRLVKELSKLPGIGEKTALRLAYFILRKGSQTSIGLQEALYAVNENIRLCSECFSYTEESDLCRICSDSHRDLSSLCVVEDPSDIEKVERAGVFQGRYHVLQGAISPLDGVQPENLKIEELIERINDSDGLINEVILALDADLEGDTTALYLAKRLQGKVRITRIAHGVPFGGDIDYIDQRTLGRALENRVEL